MCLLFIFQFRAQNTAFGASEPEQKTVNTLCFPLFRELGGSWTYPLRIRSKPSKTREKWKTPCVYCLFSSSELKALRFGFRTGKKNKKHIVFFFPLFRGLGGSWIYRLRIRSKPSIKLEKSGKHRVFTVYFPVPSSKHCVWGFRTGTKNSKHTVFSTFPWIGRVLDLPVEEPVRTFQN